MPVRSLVSELTTAYNTRAEIKKFISAGVAKLADALALGASGSNPMEVQVLSPAQT